MKACWCALPALNDNTDCCKNCPNSDNYKVDPYKPTIITTTDSHITTDWANWLNIKKVDAIKTQMESCNIKELKELYEWLKQFETIFNKI